MKFPGIPVLPRVASWARGTAAQIHYEFQPLHIFALIGVLFTLHVAERALDFLLFHFATPQRPLRAYRRRGPKPTYALITGASAGIGLGIAKALVRQGFGVIILGHKADELAAAAAELRAALVLPADADPARYPPAEYVRTIVMDAVTATPEEMEAGLRGAVVGPGLRVSILVNNVGSIPIELPAIRELATHSAVDVDDTIAMNARFPARLTALMLPVLTHRGAGVDDHGMSFGTHRRSLVLNLASGGMTGLPYMVMYSATKGFNYSFSKALSREMECSPKTSHMDVLCILPGDVKSQGNNVPLSKWSPDADTFGRHIVNKTDGAVRRGWREMHPHWAHKLEAVMMGVISERMLTKGIRDVATYKRDVLNAQSLGKTKDQ